MPPAKRAGPKKTTPKSFKVYRPQEGIDFPPVLHEEFESEFPSYKLYADRLYSVVLIGHREARRIIKQSEQLRGMRVKDMVRALQREGELSALENLPNVRPKRIEYRRWQSHRGLNISLELDDEEGVLKAERERYLKVIHDLGGLEVPQPDFIPEIILGIVSSAVPTNTEALSRIIPFLPRTVTLRPVQFTPDLRAELTRVEP